MTLLKGPFGCVFGGTEPGLEFEPFVLNGLVQVRQQGCMFARKLKSIVKSVTQVSSSRIEKKLLDYFEDDCIGVNAQLECCQCGRCVV